jgi:hypothetical protein
MFSAVPDFANAVLSPFWQTIGQRTIINTFTEIVLEGDKESSRDRPDGLIIIKRGNNTWTALVEAKVRKSKIEKEQIERYLRLANLHSINALITI